MSGRRRPRPVTTLGVAGGTGSGKTSVARTILEMVGSSRIAFLVQDAYYRDIEWRSEEQLRAHNFDHPDSLDTELLVEHLQLLRAGRDVDAPIYDFVVHRRRSETRKVEARPVVLVEGILLFNEPRLRELLDFKIYVDTDADVRLVRRLQRDLSERGRSVEDVLRQYLSTVRPMHLEFIEPSKRWADIIVPEGAENRVAMEMVTARIEEILAGGSRAGEGGARAEGHPEEPSA
jgi:uridine kinase